MSFQSFRVNALLPVLPFCLFLTELVKENWGQSKTYIFLFYYYHFMYYYYYYYYQFIYYYFMLLISREFHQSLNYSSSHRVLAILFCDKFKKTYIYISFLSFLYVFGSSEIEEISAVERWIQLIKIKNGEENILNPPTITVRGVSLTHVPL